MRHPVKVKLEVTYLLKTWPHLSCERAAHPVCDTLHVLFCLRFSVSFFCQKCYLNQCVDVKDERPVPDINYGLFQASHPEIWENCTGENSHPFAKESLSVFRHMNPPINPQCACQVYIALLSDLVFAQKSLALCVRNTFLVKKQASLTSVGASSPPPSRSRWLCAYHSIFSRSPPVASATARGLILSSLSYSRLKPPGFNPSASVALRPQGQQTLCQWGLSLFSSSHSPCIPFPHPTRAASASGFCATRVPSLSRFPSNMLVIDPHPISA